MKNSPFILGIAVGLVFGAASGLLFAPLSGRNLRRFFKKKVRLLNFFDEMHLGEIPVMRKFTPWKGGEKPAPEKK
jgi:gas vesicle protein